MPEFGKLCGHAIAQSPTRVAPEIAQPVCCRQARVTIQFVQASGFRATASSICATSPDGTKGAIAALIALEANH